jgi:hypothetical protein
MNRLRGLHDGDQHQLAACFEQDVGLTHRFQARG